MKEIRNGILIGIILAILLSPITAKASTKEEEWLKKQQATSEKFMEELEKDGNLTQNAIDSLKVGKTKKKANKKTEKSSINKTTPKSTGKGWVYSTDELHVTGLPTDTETGYTVSGWYGDIK